MKEIETLSSEIVYQNRWMRVREDKIRRPSGHEGIYGVVDKPDFAVILPIDGDGIYLVQQYRYPVEARFWELPQGSWEDTPEADHFALAAGELEEETGLHASNLQYVGHQYLAYGYSSQGYHIYLAEGLQPTRQQLDAEEEGLICKRFSLREFRTMLVDGTIKDATTLAAFALAQMQGLIKG